MVCQSVMFGCSNPAGAVNVIVKQTNKFDIQFSWAPSIGNMNDAYFCT